jgi:diguanylate cyclase (GGDEF)-like protein
MNNMYIAMEALAAFVILILIYANIYEVKQHSKKRNVFTKLLIANEVVVVVDALSWMHFSWSSYPMILGILVAITFLGTPVMQIFFMLYLYEHISLNAKLSKKPVNFMVVYSIIEGIIIFLLCVSEKLYTIQDGKYHAGPLEGVYYLISMISIIILGGIVVSYRKKVSTHDMTAALSYCVVPLASVAVTLLTGLNVSITLMSVSMLVMYVMLQSENESFLYSRANLDELTGLYNRAAYEDEVLKQEESKDDSLIYASIDVNGLKIVNDNLGHTAGDELIRGAAMCLNRAFGKYGKVFRTGGDEFVAIFSADDNKFANLQDELETIAAEWKGKEVDSLTLSVGYVRKKEFPDDSIVELAKIADKRMYDDKSRFYASKGVDRRGQNDAHKVLCALYTKILRINITDDTYAIVNMNMDEQNKEKGFADSISGWLEGFGRSGQVHSDDLEDYLSKTNLDYMRNYFKRGKTSLSVTYRRKYDTVFKQVMMEIIPTNEYSDDNQSLYLYVKDIDI